MHIVAHCVSSDLCSGIIRCFFYYTICAHSVCGLLPFMARHSCGSRSRSRSVKGEGKQRTKGKGKGKGGTRSRSRSAKGEGKQRTKGKGKGKDEEPRNVPPSLVYAQNSPKGDGKGAQQNNFQRHSFVRFLVVDCFAGTAWTEAYYVDAAAALLSSD